MTVEPLEVIKDARRFGDCAYILLLAGAPRIGDDKASSFFELANRVYEFRLHAEILVYDRDAFWDGVDSRVGSTFIRSGVPRSRGAGIT